MSPSAPQRREILRRTSRTFELSMRLLPATSRGAVELAYLLARAADTIADASQARSEARRDALATLLEALETSGRAESAAVGTPERALRDLRALAPPDEGATSRAEAALLAELPTLVSELHALAPFARREVSAVIETLVRTMIDELERFGDASAAMPAALPDEAALESYTEGIAGSVGAFWTRLVVGPSCGLAEARVAALAVEGRRYGRGLQLINVLRDAGEDLGRGRVYLPASALSALGVSPQDLAAGRGHEALAPLEAALRARAKRGVLAGVAYAGALPLGAPRLRVASLLPGLIGLSTLRLLDEAPSALAPTGRGRKVKVSRPTLRRLLAASLALGPLPGGPARAAARAALGGRRRAAPLGKREPPSA